MKTNDPWADAITGTGPGAIAPDGSPVEFYALFPVDDGPSYIQQVVPAGGSILELAAGAGRVTTALVRLGYKVVAVDQSADMLAHIQGVETVCARIEELRLDRRFDAVVLPSYLINWPDDKLRHAFLRTCREHVKDAGAVLIEWQPAEWYDTVTLPPPLPAGVKRNVWIQLVRLERPAEGVISATVEYRIGERIWTQSFVTQRLSDEDLTECLRRSGLRFERFLNPERGWIHAVPDQRSVRSGAF